MEMYALAADRHSNSIRRRDTRWATTNLSIKIQGVPQILENSPFFSVVYQRRLIERKIWKLIFHPTEQPASRAYKNEVSSRHYYQFDGEQ